MANLDFSRKYIEKDSDDEINNLGRSINIVSDKLEKTIKQLKETNIELEKDIEHKSRIDEMRKQFISDVSHELKTPIALIQGYAEGLKENVIQDEESKKLYVEVILDEANKMDKLVKQLLELMKLEYGKREFNNEEFDILELAKEVVRKCEDLSEEDFEALKVAGMTLDQMDAIAVTYGPGLVGSLLVGVSAAKAIAYAKKLPLVGVHHIEGHVAANFIEHPELEPPFICLIVS